jgi:hypothetical protein
MMRPDEMETALYEADETLADARRYLTEFGSVEPEVLARRIDQWRGEFAIMRSRAKNEPV